MKKTSTKIADIPQYKLVFWGLLLANIALVAVTIGAFIFGYQQLQTKTQAAQQAITDAETSRQNLTNMQGLRPYLNRLSATVKTADKMAALLEAHRYQDQTVSILKGFADRSGVQITQIDFTADKEADQTNSKSVIVKASLKSPLSYDSFLKFLLIVENEISPLQLTSVSLQQATEDNKLITVGDIEFKVYVK